MAKLFLLRHLKSQWNEENRFTGWVDVPVAKNQDKEAEVRAREIFKNKIDIIYSSALFRNMDTVAEILEKHSHKYPIFIHLDSGRMKNWGKFIDMSDNDVPVFVTEKLNERSYGDLQGRDKKETIRKFGEEKVKLWRRSYTVAPPEGESLKETFKRTIPFFKKNIEKKLEEGENVLVVGSHNPLRTIVKYLEKISDEEIINFEIEFGGLIEYDLDKNLEIISKKIHKISL